MILVSIEDSERMSSLAALDKARFTSGIKRKEIGSPCRGMVPSISELSGGMDFLRRP